MVISSCIEGRLRIRDERLRKAEVAAAVRGVLEAVPGVVSISVSERVGSLLVVFESAVTKAASVLEPLRGIFGPEKDPDSGGARTSPKQAAARRRTKTRSMLAALLMVAIAAAAGIEQLHIGAGLLFLTFVIDHLRERWGMLFPKGTPKTAAA